jgi:hypothetical protein
MSANIHYPSSNVRFQQNVKDKDHSVNLSITRKDNINVQRAGVDRTGFSWFRVGDQRRALVNGNKLSVSRKADKYFVQRSGHLTLKSST